MAVELIGASVDRFRRPRNIAVSGVRFHRCPMNERAGWRAPLGVRDARITIFPAPEIVLIVHLHVTRARYARLGK